LSPSDRHNRRHLTLARAAPAAPGPADPDTDTDTDPDAAAALAEFGWDAGWAAAARTAAESAPAGPGPAHPAGSPDPAGSLRPGRVVRADRGRVLVATGTGTVHPAVIDPDLTTGDWVLCDGELLRAVLPRRTALVRGAGRKDARGQVLAANIDVVLVVVALTSPPQPARLDRLLTVAWNSGATPVVVLTKADLCRTAQTEQAEVAEAAPGVPVILTSAVDGQGLAELRGHLAPGRTLALLGASGAGKSSLVNALADTDVAAVAPIRPDGRGRHTTTARDLVVLPGLGVLVDTPGLRGLQLWSAEDGLDRTFADVLMLAEQCRFRDCAHGVEPGCAVAAAVADGRLAARRLDSYVRLQRENAWLQRRYDARLRAEQRRRWRSRVWEVRHSHRPRHR
jgi:ribosome biogenesis GTPase